MKYQFSFHSYTRKFKTPLVTHHGEWAERKGIIIRLKDEKGNIGFGEIAPIPFFQHETIEQAKEYCLRLKGKLDKNTIASIPKSQHCTQYAFNTARLQIAKRLPTPEFNQGIAGLLPSGAESINTINSLIKNGHTTLKWKIGVLDFNQETSIFQQLAKIAGPNISFRLDANEGLDHNSTQSWLSFLDNYAVEFLEQPMPKGKEIEMNSLTNQYKTKIALDESVLGLDEIKKAEQIRWNGFLIIKPSLTGDIQSFLNWRETSTCPLVYSTALETAIGTQAGLSIASSDKKNNYALGFGVNHFFNNDGYNTTEEINTLWED